MTDPFHRFASAPQTTDTAGTSPPSTVATVALPHTSFAPTLATPSGEPMMLSAQQLAMAAQLNPTHLYGLFPLMHPSLQASLGFPPLQPQSHAHGASPYMAMSAQPLLPQNYSLFSNLASMGAANAQPPAWTSLPLPHSNPALSFAASRQGAQPLHSQLPLGLLPHHAAATTPKPSSQATKQPKTEQERNRIKSKAFRRRQKDKLRTAKMRAQEEFKRSQSLIHELEQRQVDLRQLLEEYPEIAQANSVCSLSGPFASPYRLESYVPHKVTNMPHLGFLCCSSLSTCTTNSLPLSFEQYCISTMFKQLVHTHTSRTVMC
eukprot:m.179764 g.179764  ORF g.179764 m.179764 type:complete len:319 (+) comp14649_c0_seq4:825-1781(+)